jgi:crossover junction endodeoxyribonuclease RuvC
LLRAGNGPEDLVQRTPPIELMDNLLVDEIRKNEKYQGSQDIGRENATLKAALGIEYYFDIFVQSYDQSASKIILLLQKPSKIILGIDPGTVIMGYGLVVFSGNRLSLLEMGTLKLSSHKDAYERLQLIHKKVFELIGQFNPDDFAIEAPFFGKNVQSMLKLGRAQGVAIATAMHAGIPVTEYSPKKIKQSITGNGNSQKEQVWKMLQNILQLEGEIASYDASDALAVAVCHHFQNNYPATSFGKSASPAAVSGKKLNGWKDFIRNNPGKIHAR